MTARPLHAHPLRDRLFAYAGLGFIAAVWGATFFIIKDATADYSIMAFLAVRFGIASLALLPFVLQLRRLPTRAELRWGILAGLLFGAGYVFQTFALRFGDSGRVGFITGLYVVLVPLLALVLLRYPLKLRIVIATVLALVGLVLLSYVPGSNLVGDVLAFLCSLSFAGQILVVEKFPRQCDWRYTAVLQSATTGVMAVVLLPLMSLAGQCTGSPACEFILHFQDHIPTTLPLNILLVALFTGLVASAFGLWMQIWAQKILPPSDAALIYALESPFAAIFGVAFRGERLTDLGILGCVLLSASMFTVTIGGDKTDEVSVVPAPQPALVEATVIADEYTAPAD